MRITLKGTAPRLNINQYLKDLRYSIEVLSKTAVGEALKIMEPMIPIWSGESQASLMLLEQSLGLYFDISKNSGNLSGIELGKSKSEPSNPDDVFKWYDDLFKIYFSTNVPHFLENDTTYMNDVKPLLKHETPWGSFDAGQQFVTNMIRFELSSVIPNISEYLEGTEI